MSRRARSWLIISVVAVVALIALSLGAWAYDSRANEGRAARGVEVAGRPVGGQTPAQVAQTVAALAQEYQGAWVKLTSPQGDLDTTASLVGLQLDQPATVAAAMAVDGAATGTPNPVIWAQSLVAHRAVPLSFTVDATELGDRAAAVVLANHTAPSEPTVRATETGMVAVPGTPGQTVDVADLAVQLQRAAQSGTTPITVAVKIVPIAPRFTDGEATALADKASAITKTPLNLSVGGKSATIASPSLRSWLTAEPGPSSLDLQVDQARIQADLPGFVGDLGTPPVPATFTVAPDPETKADKVTIVDGADGTTCCAPDSASRIANALLSGQTSVSLDLQPVPPERDRAWAESLKIGEVVSTFTTPHACCEPRVTNIHHIADATRGMVIAPGETFSVNDRVGQRTAEKGYVEAPVIYNATHDTDIGGGVSQYATTLFNAAFFAGLDLVDYQSHSEYISRYPKGREATISWTKPDLKIRNNTPFGILIWPTYTDTSLTVTLYSTPWAVGEQTGQTTEPKGECTRYKTERTRTFLVDGHKEVDYVYATYQPADGVKCP